MERPVLRTSSVFRNDDSLLRELRSANRANLTSLLAYMPTRDPDLAGLQPAALSFTQAAIRRGAPMAALHEAERAWQQDLWAYWMNLVAPLTDSRGDLLDLLNESHHLIDSFNASIFAATALELRYEATHLMSDDFSRRASLVMEVLEGSVIDLESAGRQLRYSFDQHHTALALWVPPEHSRTLAQRTLTAVAEANHLPLPPLSIPVGPSTLWAWIGRSTPPTKGPAITVPNSTIDPAVRIAVGPTRAGFEGFRNSHRAAVATLDLLTSGTDATRVVQHAEVEPVLLTSDDIGRASEFFNATLGPLAADTETAATLRETLRVYLEEADNAPRAAVRLHIHRNTVLQRIERATELLGYPPAQRRLALHLALELSRWTRGRP
jgi:DNA-binding PucR family transcriptional regulator